ncbi:MAG: hypothetical protein GVY25_04170 [Bacteroidetes bacterium]|jgi:hypothetical protein|nr:hypothetical protein [Bacteroidota bacterium]
MTRLDGDLLLTALITLVAAYLLGGFVYGVVGCKGCDGIWGNLLGRPFIGFISMINSAITGGFPITDEGDVGARGNAWPYIAGCWVAMMALVWYRSKNG